MENWMQTSESLISFFLLVKGAVKFRNLQISKIHNTDTNKIFPNRLRLCTYLWDFHSLKNNSAVGRSGCLYGVNQEFSSKKCFFKGTSLKYIYIYIYIYIYEINYNPLLSKPMLKYLPSLLPSTLSKYCDYKTNAYWFVRWCFLTAFPITC